MRLRGVFVALTLSGCGSVSDNSNNVDAAIVADTTGPAIVSSSPVDKGTKASVLSPVSVYVDEALDAASVTAATVRLGYAQALYRSSYFLTPDLAPTTGPGGASVAIPGTVEYDDAHHKITFVPLAPLPWGQELTLTLDGIKDVAGNATKTSIKFTTYVNGQRAAYSYNKGAPVANWIENGRDMFGQPAYQASRSGPGPDGVFFTADDPQSSTRPALHYGTDGRLLDERSVSYGTDSMFGTPDDVTNAYISYTYNADGQVTDRVGTSNPGTDMMYGTPDDVLAFVTPQEYASGVAKGFVVSINAGADLVWRTPDDQCVAYVDYEFNPAGLKTREIVHGCGSDSLLRNADDVINYYKEYSYDTLGVVTRATGRVNPGTDNMWMTPDDGFGNGGPLVPTRYDRDAKERVTLEQRISGPGTDAMWFTPDDLGTQFRMTYLANGLLEESVTFTAFGANNTWGDADDVCSSYVVYTYDANGNRINSKTYATGIDGKPHTFDDQFVGQVDFDTAH